MMDSLYVGMIVGAFIGAGIMLVIMAYVCGPK